MQYLFRTKFFLAIVCSIGCLLACDSSNEERAVNVNKLAADAPVSVEVVPFFADLIAFKSNPNKKVAYEALQDKHGAFFTFYVEQLAALGQVNQLSTVDKLLDFLNNPFIDTLFIEANLVYQNFEPYKEAYSAAFGRVKSYFPAFETPTIQLIVSGFGVANGLTDSAILVGLDMYLGRNFRYYPKVDFIMDYQRRRLESVYLVPHGMRLIAEDLVGEPNPNGHLLEHMIHAGKALYLLEQFLPHANDSLLTDYSTEQLSWCVQSEGSIWAYLIDNELLYKQDAYVVRKWLNDAPFTNGLPSESPGKLGVWVGWQIVRNYMRNNPHMSPAQLLQNQDFDQILAQAKYRPKAGIK